MKTYLLGVLILPVMVAVAWHPHGGDVKVPAQQLASTLSVILPKDLGGGNELRSATAEGDTLVLTVAMPSSQVLSGSEISKIAGASFCQTTGGRRFIENGGKLRLDVAMGGEPAIHGDQLETCPGA